MPINPEKVKNILVLRNDRFGEFLLNIPAFRALKETFDRAKIIAVVDPYVKELAECMPYIDEIIERKSGEKLPFREKLRLMHLLRGKNIDIAVMFNPSRDFNVASFLAGIPVRAGYDKKWGFLLTHRIEEKKHLGQKHEIEYNLDLVGAIGVKTNNKSLNLNIVEQDINSLCGTGGLLDCKNLVVLHPGTSDPLKQWPLNNFKELAVKLIKDLGVKIVIVGGAEELNKSRELFNGLRDESADLRGKTSLRQLAAVLKKSRLLISCDSGPVHLAGCVDIPALVIFRNDLPGKTAVRWGPVSRGSAVVEKGSLNDISVEEVFLKAKDMLKK